MGKNILFAMVFLLLFISFVFASSSVKILMYPDSNSYILRTYTLSKSGPFVLKPEDIKETSPSALSVFSESADVYFISQYITNGTKQERKKLTDLINESIGKQVFLRTNSGTFYNSTLLWYDDNYVGLAGKNNMQIVSLEHIAEISLPQTNPFKDVNYNKTELAVFGTSKKDNSVLTFGYVKRDLSWNIDYDLVISGGKGKLIQYATITNNGDETYSNAAVTLSMLKVNFVGSPRPYYYLTKSSLLYEAMPPSSQPSLYKPEFEASFKEGIWSYTPSTPVTLCAHSSHKMIVFKDDAVYTKKYIWDVKRGDNVYRVYELNNTRKEVLPAGTVHVFDEGVFVGENTIDFLGTKSSKELYVSNVPHIEVDRTVLSDSVTGSSITTYTHTVKVRLKLKNRGNSTERVEVREDLSGYNDLKYVSYSVQPFKVEGGKAYWNISLSGGAEQIIEYVYTYSSTY